MAVSEHLTKTWFDYIKQNSDKGWNFDYLSSNPNTTWNIVAANPDKAWYYSHLSMNPNITWVLNLQKGMVYAMHLTGTISLAIALFHSNWAHLFDFNCGDVFRLPPGW